MRLFELIKKKEIKSEIILLSITIFSLLLLLFQFQTRSKLRDTLETETSLFQETKNFELLKQRHEKLQEELNNLQKLLPGQERFSEFLAVLAEIAGKTGVKVTSITPLSQKREDPYQEISIEMYARGGYHNFGKFLNRLENSSRLFVDVKDFWIKANSDLKNYEIHTIFTTFGLLEVSEHE